MDSHTAFDITYHMELVRHTDFESYCCGTEIHLEMSTNTLGIDACNFTLIHLLFFSIVMHTTIRHISGTVLGTILIINLSFEQKETRQRN